MLTSLRLSCVHVAPPDDRKELFKRYQSKMKEMKKSKKAEDKLSLKNINVGIIPSETLF